MSEISTRISSGVDAAFLVEDDLEMGADAVDLGEDLLDLRGEEADAAEEDQVVGPARDAGHADEGPAAGAGRRVEPR